MKDIKTKKKCLFKKNVYLKKMREKLMGWTKKYLLSCRDTYFIIVYIFLSLTVIVYILNKNGDKLPICFFYQEWETCDVTKSLITKHKPLLRVVTILQFCSEEIKIKLYFFLKLSCVKKRWQHLWIKRHQIDSKAQKWEYYKVCMFFFKWHWNTIQLKEPWME